MASGSSPSSSSSSQWDNPDPRVKWALDAFDYEGCEPNSLPGYYWPVIALSTIGFSTNPFNNYLRRRPLMTGLPVTVLYTGLGILAGFKYRDWATERRQKEVAVIKHYIMTHPEKFPEPERKTFGDKLVLLHWSPIR